MTTSLIMQNLQRALDDSGITMTEAFMPKCLHADMDERLTVLGMDHQLNTKETSLFCRKSDIEGLLRASDRLRSKASGEQIKTQSQNIDCLLFWKNAIIPVNFEDDRNYLAWLRISRPESRRFCCVCQIKTIRDDHTNCNICQSICFIQCDQGTESGSCPVCRSPGKFVLHKKMHQHMFSPHTDSAI